MRTIQKLLLAVLMTILCYGCKVGPNYHPPELCIPEGWTESPSEIVVAHDDGCPRTDWWTLFCDPLLDKYIEMGAYFNNDIHSAEATVMQAIALRQVAASQLFPQISADFNASRTYFSKNGPVFSIGQGGDNPSTGLPFQIQIPQIQNVFNAFLEGSWEIDLFGKTRREIEVAEAQIGSAIEQRNDILISVLAEIARNYMEVRANQQKGILVEENIDFLEKNANIARLRLEAGYSDQLDFERLEAELAVARADLPTIYAQIYRGIFALSVLTGSLPECLLVEMLPIQAIPLPPENIAIGLRSDLLRRRPDVRFAERQLAAATANIGVAVASFFPTITLMGNIGFQSLNLYNLFQAGSKTWSIGADVNMPIFQGGNLIGNLHASEAATAAAAYAYQQTVLNAIRDAESALISYNQEFEKSILLNEAVEKNQRVVQITSERYQKGIIDLIDLLDSERQLNAARQNLLNTDMNVLLDIVELYKALGGGWEPKIVCD